MKKRLVAVLLCSIILTSCASTNSGNVSAENEPSTNNPKAKTDENRFKDTPPPKIINISPVLDVLQDDDVLIMLNCFYPNESKNDTMGVLIVQANGLVYYAFNTIEIKVFNSSDFGTQINKNINLTNIKLDEKTELGYITGDELTKLKEHALSVDLSSDFYENFPLINPTVMTNDVIRYQCIKWDENHKYEKFHIITNGIIGYENRTYDGNAWEVYKILNDLECVKQWKEVCAEKLGHNV